jgi:hypothetical protein
MALMLGSVLQEVYGYRRNWLRTCLCYMGIVLTAGFLRLFLHWMPQLLLSFTHSPCPLTIATRILFVVCITPIIIKLCVMRPSTWDVNMVRRAVPLCIWQENSLIKFICYNVMQHKKNYLLPP